MEGLPTVSEECLLNAEKKPVGFYVFTHLLRIDSFTGTVLRIGNIEIRYSLKESRNTRWIVKNLLNLFDRRSREGKEGLPGRGRGNTLGKNMPRPSPVPQWTAEDICRNVVNPRQTIHGPWQLQCLPASCLHWGFLLLMSGLPVLEDSSSILPTLPFAFGCYAWSHVWCPTC